MEPSGSAVFDSPPLATTTGAPWDFGTWNFSLADLGQTVGDGLTAVAGNISDFVADLASAFDAGWDGGEEEHHG